jgi:hypothetical protein
MAVGVMMQFSSGSNEAYDRLLDQLGLAGGSAPDGVICHMAGETSDGFRVVEAWESAEAFGRFVARRLAAGSSLEGFPPPRVTIWDLHHVIVPGPAGAVSM